MSDPLPSRVSSKLLCLHILWANASNTCSPFTPLGDLLLGVVWVQWRSPHSPRNALIYCCHKCNQTIHRWCQIYCPHECHQTIHHDFSVCTYCGPMQATHVAHLHLWAIWFGNVVACGSIRCPLITWMHRFANGILLMDELFFIAIRLFKLWHLHKCVLHQYPMQTGARWHCHSQLQMQNEQMLGASWINIFNKSSIHLAPQVRTRGAQMVMEYHTPLR